MRPLEGKYSGPLTMVGNGPSLDVEAIEGPSLAMNSISLLYDKTDWRPDFYVNVSDALRKNELSHERVMDNVVLGIPCFLRCELLQFIDDARNIYWISVAPVRVRTLLPLDWSQDGVWVYDFATSMMPAAQIAQYIGFEKLKFVGMDGYVPHKMGEPDINHFDETYNDGLLLYDIDDPFPLNYRMQRAYDHIRRMFGRDV